MPETPLFRLAVPVWRAAGTAPIAALNDPAREWMESPGWPGLQRLLKAMIALPGHASGSFESGGKVFQVLTIDAEEGPIILMRPVREGEREGEVEHRLAEVVHDLNTPLTSLRLRLGGLRATPELMQAVRDDLAHAERDLERLQAIVRDAAALGRLRASRLEKTPTDLRLVIENVAHTLRPIAQAANVRIETACDPGEATVDGVWIGRALVNLGENAVRHSPTGERVTIEGKRKDDRWLLRVRDRGRGISAEVLGGLGQPYLQADEGSKGLAGLGLTLVRRIVAAHGGDLEVASEEESGSTFTLSLPDGSPPIVPPAV